jgi:multisubunit Na+/H+ antiporter MnhF subunit
MRTTFADPSGGQPSRRARIVAGVVVGTVGTAYIARASRKLAIPTVVVGFVATEALARFFGSLGL